MQLPYTPRDIKPILSPSRLAAPSQKKKKTDLAEIASQLLLKSQYDPSQDYQELDILNNMASAGPYPEDLQARLAGAKAKSAITTNELLSKIAPPRRERLDQTPLPALSLPQIPQRQRLGIEPLSAIASALFGAFSPKDAPTFGAAALRGSIQGGEQKFQDDIQRYQAEFQQRTALHADELRREDVRRRIESENKQTDYENDVATTAERMKAAVRAGQAEELGGEAEVTEKYAREVKVPRQAGVEAKTLAERIKRSSDADLKRESKALSLLQADAQIGSREDLARVREGGIDARSLRSDLTKKSEGELNRENRTTNAGIMAGSAMGRTIKTRSSIEKEGAASRANQRTLATLKTGGTGNKKTSQENRLKALIDLHKSVASKRITAESEGNKAKAKLLFDREKALRSEIDALENNAPPVKVNSKAQYDKLPSGTLFIAPNGDTKRKP